MFTAIMRVEENRVAKYADWFNTQEDAEAHVEEFADRYPDAFVVDGDTIDGPVMYWWVEGQEVTVVPPPEPRPEPQPVERDYGAEIDALTLRVEALEAKA